MSLWCRCIRGCGGKSWRGGAVNALTTAKALKPRRRAGQSGSGDGSDGALVRSDRIDQLNAGNLE